MIRLTELRDGETALVVGFEEGAGGAARVAAMGLRVGKTVTKISGMPFKGPIVVQVGGTRIALGHRMGARVLVERP
ncbi:MAG TPA: FeoA family protein [bacterium]|nr:FeoA family protein [bacterium]HPQ66818.1 FeoA family protein [bacterium]